MVQTCCHIKTNGELCQSPAIHGSDRCYFHANLEERRRRSRKNNQELALQLPPLEDANAVQLALMETIDGLVDGRLDPRLGHLVLSALRTASVNLRHTSFAPKAEVAATELPSDSSEAEPELLSAIPPVPRNDNAAPTQQ